MDAAIGFVHALFEVAVDALKRAPQRDAKAMALRSRRPISIPWSARYSGTERTCRRSPQKTLQRRRWSAGNGALKEGNKYDNRHHRQTEPPRTFGAGQNGADR